MTTPTTPLPMPIRLHPERVSGDGADIPAGGGTPCADFGRCDRANCGHAERVVRHCPGDEDHEETPL